MTQQNESGSDQVAHHLVLAHYFPAQGNEARVLELLHSLTAASRTEEGNVGYDHYAPGSRSGEILIVERYISAEAFAIHRETEHFRSIGKEQIIPLLDERMIEEFEI